MNNSKLKILTLVLAAFAIVSALPCFCAEADSSLTTYELTEINMTIDVPSQTSVITSAVKKNDKSFRDGTFDYLTAMSKMREDNAYLYGKNVADGYEIEVMSMKNEDKLKDLSKLKEKKLNKLFDNYSKQEDIVESSIYKNGYLTFLFASRTSNGPEGRFFYSDYYTVYDGNDIMVRLISENDNITQEELSVLKTVTDSIRLPVKRRLSLKALPGKSVFYAFIFLTAAFILIVLYRRHDEKVNAVILPIAEKCKAFTLKTSSALKEKAKAEKEKLAEKAENAQKASKREEPAEKPSEVSDQTDDTAPNEQSEVEEEDDEDLSSIDLDAAIALFDDSSV